MENKEFSENNSQSNYIKSNRTPLHNDAKVTPINTTIYTRPGI